MATALAIGWVSRRGGLRFDTAVGVLFAGMFALGIVLFSTIDNYVADLFSYLLGNVLGITTGDLAQIALLGTIVLAVVFVLRNELLYSTFDPAGAAAAGLPVTTLEYLLLGLLGVTIVVSIQAVGIIMVVAMLVTPAATAQLLVVRYGRMVALAVAAAALVRGHRAVPELLPERRLGRVDRAGRDGTVRCRVRLLAPTRAPREPDQEVGGGHDRRGLSGGSVVRPDRTEWDVKPSAGSVPRSR